MIKAQDFSPDQRRLRDLMSDYSEDFWCAGWLIGLEEELWRTIHAGPLTDQLDKIARQAAICGGWITWDEDSLDNTNLFLTWEEWGRELGLEGPARLPDRYNRPRDERSKLLEGLSRSQLVNLVLSFSFCKGHLEKHVRSVDSLGGYAGCLHCGAIEASAALSEIDILTLGMEPDADGNVVGVYDIDYDPQGVVSRLRKLLKDFPRRRPI